ncbi:asparagine synthetase domain-containing protein 1 isoform X2 [Mangifera indica]|uniref:asparagine synthetase domain-containing protein 1 isoform X2 n=1 Tax=Mangifera indica TaxID=29780 RepID=UPI001CFA47EC|nr:asparagine synthetase domain-containing protein 1 isoform X2 [Mangifera indica]
MCGIALIIHGLHIDLSSIFVDATSPKSHREELVFSVDNLKATLRRRGPDSLSCKKVHLYSNTSTSPQDQEFVSVTEDCIFTSVHYQVELLFIGATLQLRGVNPISQPLQDSSKNILVYNGEIFGGIHVESDSNDTEVLLQALEQCCSCNSNRDATCLCKGSGRCSVVDVLSAIKGPWALIYWQDSSKTLWFGRDAFGRRSLLVHWPTAEDPQFLLSSVSPPSSVEQISDFEAQTGISKLNFWEELPCGIYSMSMDVSKLDGGFVGNVKKHEWTNAMLNELVKWERMLINPKPEVSHLSDWQSPKGQHNMRPTCLDMISSESVSVQKVLNALRKSVMRRSSLHMTFQAVACDRRQKELAPVAVLFSGGLDSMILAALLNECLDLKCEIDLLNVSFDGKFAPDRISAKAGVNELRRIAPSRRWKLVEIDADLSNLISETKHVMSLINPANTYMDLNIGIALWLAAGGDGWVFEGITKNDDEDQQGVKYKSKSRIILVGSGADEQCAGYGRHKTKYRHGSWLALHEEMKLDMQRIWKRNLGRDDRCCADQGKEARFPFLDEDVIRTLLDIPLWEIANLDQPSGTGDKKILREVAKILGLHEAAVLPKRAIQFGSRIARESNRKNFGSNRAANQASAGSVVIGKQNLT